MTHQKSCKRGGLAGNANCLDSRRLARPQAPFRHLRDCRFSSIHPGDVILSRRRRISAKRLVRRAQAGCTNRFAEILHCAASVQDDGQTRRLPTVLSAEGAAEVAGCVWYAREDINVIGFIASGHEQFGVLRLAQRSLRMTPKGAEPGNLRALRITDARVLPNCVLNDRRGAGPTD